MKVGCALLQPGAWAGESSGPATLFRKDSPWVFVAVAKTHTKVSFCCKASSKKNGCLPVSSCPFGASQAMWCDICSLNTIQKQPGLIHRTLITAKRPLLDKLAPLDVSRQGTDPAHPVRTLTPGDDPFALSAAPMLCFIKTSFCKVPWPWLQQWQPLFTSALPSEHRLKAPGHHPKGRWTHSSRALWFAEERPRGLLTASTRDLRHKAGPLLQPGVFKKFFL